MLYAPNDFIVLFYTLIAIKFDKKGERTLYLCFLLRNYKNYFHCQTINKFIVIRQTFAKYNKALKLLQFDDRMNHDNN